MLVSPLRMRYGSSVWLTLVVMQRPHDIRGKLGNQVAEDAGPGLCNRTLVALDLDVGIARLPHGRKRGAAISGGIQEYLRAQLFLGAGVRDEVADKCVPGPRPSPSALATVIARFPLDDGVAR